MTEISHQHGRFYYTGFNFLNDLNPETGKAGIAGYSANCSLRLFFAKLFRRVVVIESQGQTVYLNKNSLRKWFVRHGAALDLNCIEASFQQMRGQEKTPSGASTPPPATDPAPIEKSSNQAEDKVPIGNPLDQKDYKALSIDLRALHSFSVSELKPHLKGSDFPSFCLNLLSEQQLRDFAKLPLDKEEFTDLFKEPSRLKLLSVDEILKFSDNFKSELSPKNRVLPEDLSEDQIKGLVIRDLTVDQFNIFFNHSRSLEFMRVHLWKHPEKQMAIFDQGLNKGQFSALFANQYQPLIRDLDFALKIDSIRLNNYLPFLIEHSPMLGEASLEKLLTVLDDNERRQFFMKYDINIRYPRGQLHQYISFFGDEFIKKIPGIQLQWLCDSDLTKDQFLKLFSTDISIWSLRIQDIVKYQEWMDINCCSHLSEKQMEEFYFRGLYDGLLIKKEDNFNQIRPDVPLMEKLIAYKEEKDKEPRILPDDHPDSYGKTGTRWKPKS